MEEFSSLKVAIDQTLERGKDLMGLGDKDQTIQLYESCLKSISDAFEEVAIEETSKVATQKTDQRQGKMRQKLTKQETCQDDAELKQIKSSILATMITPQQGLTWDLIIGHLQVKSAFDEEIVWPQLFPEILQNRIASGGVMLYGPPGCGKTKMIRIAATLGNSKLFEIRSGDIQSMWEGRTQKIIKILFQTAKINAPSIVFIDEFDSICKSRASAQNSDNKILTELLIEMNNINGTGVLVVAATNEPFVIDTAFLSRFPIQIHVPLPGLDERKQILCHYLAKIPNKLTNKQLSLLAEKLDRFSGRDIMFFTMDVAKEPFRRCTLKTKENLKRAAAELVSIEDFYTNLYKHKPAVTLEAVEKLASFQKDDLLASASGMEATNQNNKSKPKSWKNLLHSSIF